MTIKLGKKAPSFELLDQDGKAHNLNKVEADYVVIYFYPKDDTPGCTLEGQEFTKLKKSFSTKKAKIFGISGLDYKSKAKFCKKRNIGISLLSDLDFSISKQYESYGQKKFMGRSYMGILRNTFVLDSNKKVIKIFESVKAEGHAQQVLEFIKSLGSEPAGTKQQ